MNRDPQQQRLFEIEKTCVGLLARREHSALQLLQKLQQRGYETEEIRLVLVQLQDQRLQSDARFAESYVRYRSQRGFGPVRIRAELQERGVDDENVKFGFNEQQIDWYQLARDAYNKRFSNKPGMDFREQQKRRRFLQYRGFSSDQIKYALADE